MSEPFALTFPATGITGSERDRPVVADANAGSQDKEIDPDTVVIWVVVSP